MERAADNFFRHASFSTRSLTSFVRRAIVIPWFADFIRRSRGLSACPDNISDGHADLITRRVGITARHTDVIARRAHIIARRGDVIAPCADTIARHTDIIARHTDIIAPRADIIARRADMLTWSVFPIARFADCIERSRELSSRYVMSFGRATTDIGASIQNFHRYGDALVVTLHKTSWSREVTTQCVSNVEPLLNFRASAP